jgi:hypothetical protein
MLPTLASEPLVHPARSRIRISTPRIELAWTLGERDAGIIAAMLHMLAGCEPDFEQTARALHEAVVGSIPAGRVYVLGAGDRGPILGSLITGVGIAADEEGIALVRVDRSGQSRLLGRLWR